MIIEMQTTKLLLIYNLRAIMYAFFCLVNTDRSTNNVNCTKWFRWFLSADNCKAFTLIFQVDGAANRHQYCYWLSQRHYI